MSIERNASLLLNSSSFYYVTTDTEGRYNYVNALYRKSFYLPSDDITTYGFADVLLPSERQVFLLAKQDCLKNPSRIVHADLKSARPDGSLLWTRWEFSAFMENGQVAGLEGIGNDISELKVTELEKKAVQDDLGLLLNNTEEVFMVIDKELNILSFNRVAEEKMMRYYGKRLEKGLSILQFAEPERIGMLKKIYVDVLQGAHHESITRVTENGKTFIFNHHFKPVHNANREIYGIAVITRDVTQNTFAEEKLTRERYLLRILIDQIPDYIYVKDTNSRHIINNQAQVSLMGAASEEETIGKTVLDYFEESSAREQISRDRKVLESGHALNNKEESVISKAGEKKWLLTTKVPLKESDGKIIGLVGISRDISERRKIEESLRLSNERSSILSKATNDAVWDWDLRTKTTVWNEGVKRFGSSMEEIAADIQWWENHLHPEDRERVLSGLHRHIEMRIESWQDQYRFICADGTTMSIFDRGFILFDEEKKPFRMIGAMVDVTDRVKLENELVAHNVARQRQITEAAIMAQEKERAEIGRELHDNINQILTTTKLYIDMAMNEKEISEELMLKSHSNISSAIEEIRILSKSLVPPSLGDIGLKEAIAEMILNLNNSQKIKIKLRTSGFGKVNIPGNIKLMVFRIIQEQLNNIMKHSKATETEIKLVVSKESLNITVTDNGVGFDPRKKARGIGLTNITSRAEVHNGNVEIVSSPGNGCSLKVSIPV